MTLSLMILTLYKSYYEKTKNWRGRTPSPLAGEGWGGG